MAEENDGQQQSAPAGGGEFKPITSQDELNRLIGERIGKVKEKYADYDTLREKASKFDEVAEQSKSELQKALERGELAEKRAGSAEQQLARLEVALEKGLTPTQAKRLVGSTREELAADADELLKDIGAQASQTRKPAPPPSKLASGSTAPGGAESGRAAAALRALRKG